MRHAARLHYIQDRFIGRKTQPVRPQYIIGDNGHHPGLTIHPVNALRQFRFRLEPFVIARMPNTGSVNQIEPSDFTTTSFGEFSFLPCQLSASTVIEPSISVWVTRRPCSQVTSLPRRSRVLPLAQFEGLR